MQTATSTGTGYGVGTGAQCAEQARCEDIQEQELTPLTPGKEAWGLCLQVWRGMGHSQRRTGLSFEEGGLLKEWDGELVVERHRCPSEEFHSSRQQA